MVAPYVPGGSPLVIARWALAALMARGGASPRLAGLTFPWSLAVPIIRVPQDSLVRGNAHKALNA